jgi:hypothetical protein
MRFPFSGENSGVVDTREDEDILRLTGRTKRMVGVFAKPAHSQDWAGFFAYWGLYCDTSRVQVQTRPKLSAR